MNPYQWLIALDGLAVIASLWCFHFMAEGRKAMMNEPEPAPSVTYLAQSEWRR